VNGDEIISELGPIIVTASTNQYRTLFKIHLEEHYEKMYGLIEHFLRRYDIPTEIYVDLTKLNRGVVGKQRELKDYEIHTNYNILEYILDMRAELNETNQKVSVTYPHDPVRSKDLAWFMESLFFARRRSFGKNYLKVI
jgi:hypothetical protein